MANIRVDVDYTILDGSEVVFRSPVNCSAITGLKVYYPGSNGTTASKEFAFADAHGNNVGDIDHLFAENVVVKVILDVTNGMAFVQNADTNAYLEAQLAKKMCFRRLLTSADDMDNIKEDGVYVYSTSSRPANAPFENAAVVFVFGGDNTTTQKIQFGFRYGIGGQGKFRPLYEGKWNSWAEFAVAKDGIVEVKNGGTGASDKATARANLGAAPDGFGLGKAQKITATELDTTTAPGWYCGDDTITAGGLTANYWYLHVSAYTAGGTHCTQILYLCVAYNPMLKRTKRTNSWEDWRAINPRTALGVEYATMELYNGDKVYTKLLNFGTMPSVGEAGIIHEIADIKQVVRCTGANITLGTPLDCFVEDYPDGPIAHCSADKTKVSIHVNTDCSGYAAHIQIWYTKN